MIFPWMLNSRHCRGKGAYLHLILISNSCPSWTIHFLTALTGKFTSHLNAAKEDRRWRVNDSSVMRVAFFSFLFNGWRFTQLSVSLYRELTWTFSQHGFNLQELLLTKHTEIFLRRLNSVTSKESPRKENGGKKNLNVINNINIFKDWWFPNKQGGKNNVLLGYHMAKNDFEY